MPPQVALPTATAPAAPQAANPRRAGNVSAVALALPGPLLLQVRRFADDRGAFAETYSRRDFAAVGVPEEFVQDNWSLSERVGTVRGLHFQRPPHAQAKLVRVVRGRILDVAVDMRRSSPCLGRHVAVELAAGDGRMLYVPAGFAHGFCTLEPNTEVAYKAVAWPVSRGDAVLSEKDKRLPRFADLPLVFP